MADDWPDEVTPPPVVVHPGMTEAEADLQLSRNEVVRLRLRCAALQAENDELRMQNRKLILEVRAARNKKEK